MTNISHDFVSSSQLSLTGTWTLHFSLHSLLFYLVLVITMRSTFSLFKKQRRMPSYTSGQSAAEPNRAFQMVRNANEEWFRYTRGRFLSNETHEMAIRYVEFNMDELVKRAAESIGFTSAQCVRIEKFPDGMFNKTFLFTMQDGTQVVGKVPNPNAGRAHYTTASEVATMDFVSMKPYLFGTDCSAFILMLHAYLG
jgi:hypothetical protein